MTSILIFANVHEKEGPFQFCSREITNSLNEAYHPTPQPGVRLCTPLGIDLSL